MNVFVFEYMKIIMYSNYLYPQIHFFLVKNCLFWPFFGKKKAKKGNFWPKKKCIREYLYLNLSVEIFI